PLKCRIAGGKPGVEVGDGFLDSSRRGRRNEIWFGLRMHGIADVIDVSQLTGCRRIEILASNDGTVILDEQGFARAANLDSCHEWKQVADVYNVTNGAN